MPAKRQRKRQQQTLAVARTFRVGDPIPDRHSLARCPACDVGVTWPAGVAKISEMCCPSCGGPVRHTTRALRRPFWLVDRATALAQARSARAAATAQSVARAAAGETKLARNLTVGDVIHLHPSRRDDPQRILEVDLPGRARSHVGIRAQVSLETIRRSGRGDHVDELGGRLVSLPGRKEVWLGRPEADAGHTWADLPGQVAVAAAERELALAARILHPAPTRRPDPELAAYRAATAAARQQRYEQARTRLTAAREQLVREQLAREQSVG